MTRMNQGLGWLGAHTLRVLRKDVFDGPRVGRGYPDIHNKTMVSTQTHETVSETAKIQPKSSHLPSNCGFDAPPGLNSPWVALVMTIPKAFSLEPQCKQKMC